ncbi:MAG: hypothetical protein OXJ52_00645 [Oligoflexia bacterium]|nr:hypothetical protein [Oligoflexia bacterium]
MIFLTLSQINMSATPQTKEIWDIIKESQKNIKNLSVEIDKLRAIQKEVGRQMDKLSAETNEQMRRTDRKLDKPIGDTGNYWGPLGEDLVKGNLAQRLRERGIKVEGVMTNAKFRGIEFDIIAVNKKETVVVEVQAILDPSDITKFKKNMERFKTLWPEFKGKTVYGAMAFLLKANRQAESLAEKQGFFVISATGDVIIKNEKDFKPKVFS